MKSFTEYKMLSLKKSKFSSAENQLFEMWVNFLRFFHFQQESPPAAC